MKLDLPPHFLLIYVENKYSFNEIESLQDNIKQNLNVLRDVYSVESDSIQDASRSSLHFIVEANKKDINDAWQDFFRSNSLSGFFCVSQNMLKEFNDPDIMITGIMYNSFPEKVPLKEIAKIVLDSTSAFNDEFARDPEFSVFMSPYDTPSLLRFLQGKNLLKKVVVLRDYNVVDSGHNTMSAYSLSLDSDFSQVFLRPLSVSPFQIMRPGDSCDTQEISDSTYTLY
ncbi:MAG: hypothetical protein ACYTFY_12940 [Planctomycetota bacterium]